MTDARRDWPEGTSPTPAQLARYLKRAPRAERERIAALMLYDASRASRCVQLEHDGARDELRLALNANAQQAARIAELETAASRLLASLRRAGLEP